MDSGRLTFTLQILFVLTSGKTLISPTVTLDLSPSTFPSISSTAALDVDADVAWGNNETLDISEENSTLPLIEEEPTGTSSLLSSMLEASLNESVDNVNVSGIEMGNDLEKVIDGVYENGTEKYLSLDDNLVIASNQSSSSAVPGASDSDEHEMGIGESLVAAIHNMFNFSRSNNETEEVWTTDPKGEEIQSLVFA